MLASGTQRNNSLKAGSVEDVVLLSFHSSLMNMLNSGKSFHGGASSVWSASKIWLRTFCAACSGGMQAAA